MYPIVEAFPLIMQAMVLPDFPFNILGVLARKDHELSCCLGKLALTFGLAATSNCKQNWSGQGTLQSLAHTFPLIRDCL